MTTLEKVKIDTLLRSEIFHCSREKLEQKVRKTSSEDLFKILMNWIGIIGYEKDIIAAVEYCYGIEVEDKRQ